MSSSSESSDETEEPWVCYVNRVTCEWKITSAGLLSKKTGQKINSPIIRTGNCQQRWQLQLYPRGENEQCGNSTSCFLLLLSSERLGILAKFNISILKSSKMIFESTFTHKFDRLESWGWPKFSKQSILFSPDCSEITIIIHLNTDTVEATEQLGGDFRLLLQDPKFSDITLIVENEKLPAHKSILSVRSSVFAAMFTHEEMEENRKKEVKIEDMELAVVKGMLEYIYTGQVAEIKGLAEGLLAAAEKYDLGALKAMCEEALRRKLEVNNAAQILMQANLYRATSLKEFTMKFIKDNLYYVTQTDGYKAISDLALLKEIISFGLQKK